MTELPPDHGADSDAEGLPADEALDLDALRGLGIDQLGEEPDEAGWADVLGRSRRHRRSRWVPAAAAVVVLVVAASVAVVIARRGDERVQVGTAPASVEPYLLPPEGATDVGFQLTFIGDSASGTDTLPEADRVARSTLVWTSPDDGSRWSLTTGDPTGDAAGASSSDGDGEEAVAVTGLDTAGETSQRAISSNGVDAVLTCTSRDARTGKLIGPTGARGRLADGRTFLLEPVPAVGDTFSADGCDDSPETVAAAERAFGSLRVVDAATWRRYLVDQVETNTLDPSRTTGTTATATTLAPTATTTPTTQPVAPPCDGDLMWEGARAKTGIDPNDPGYADVLAPGEAPTVLFPRCVGEWAAGQIVMPYTGTTDADDVFHWVGRWEYVGDGGTPATICDYEHLGVPTAVAEELIPPSWRYEDGERRCRERYGE